MDLATLKALRPAEYAEAADGYRATSGIAGAVRDRIENQISVAMRNTLKGKAANAAVSQLAKLGGNFHYIQVQCGLVSAALEAFSYEMGAARASLDTALENAKAAGLIVHADGSVTFPPGGEKDAGGKVPTGGTINGLTDDTAAAIGRQAARLDPNPLHRPARDCADLIATALDKATAADEKWAPTLRALQADDDLTVSDTDWADALSDTKGVKEAGRAFLDSMPEPPRDGRARDNAEWWKRLDAQEQAAWVSLRPETVGALDGLPATVRDEANRIVLDTTRGAMRTELNSIPAPPFNEWTGISAGGHPSRVHTDEWMEWHNTYGDRYEHLTKSLHGMRVIQDRFDATGTKGLPEAYLDVVSFGAIARWSVHDGTG